MTFHSVPLLIILGLTAYAGLWHLLLYFRRLHNWRDLTFALLCFAVVGYDVNCIGLYNATTVAEGCRWQAGQFIFLNLTGIALLWLVVVYTESRARLLPRLLTAYLAGTTVLAFVHGGGLIYDPAQPAVKTVRLAGDLTIVYYEAAGGLLAMARDVVMIAGFGYLFWLALRQYRAGQQRRMRSLLIALAVFFLGALNDTAVSLTWYHGPYLVEYAFLAMVVLMTASLSQEVIAAALLKDALRESEERFRTLIECLPLPTVVVAGDGRIEYVNPRVTAVLGFTPADLPSVHGWAERFLPDAAGRRQFLEAWEGQRCAALAGGTHVAQHRVPDRSGRERDVVLWLAAMPAGKLSVIVEDVTEQRRAEAEIHRLNDELEARVARRTAQLEATNTELEAFCYSVSHDLRAPLRNIEGFSKALLEDCGPRLDPAGREYLQRVRGATSRMTQLLDGLLALSRLSRAEMSLGPVNLSRLAEEVINGLQAAEPGRCVTVAIAPGVTTPRADLALLRNVMQNLLGNAWKFTRQRAAAQIEFGAETRGGEMIYFVRDNGAGFDPQFADKLFTAFQRLHRPQDFEGTGIGLASVQRVIVRHGGRIWAAAAVDRGATFYFTLGEGA